MLFSPLTFFSHSLLVYFLPPHGCIKIDVIRTAGEITVLGVLIFIFLCVKLDANMKCQNYTSREAIGVILFRKITD
jgi:hypothetical protein